MLMGWLVRFGLGWALPYLIPAFIGLLLGGGFAANWWFQWLQVSDVTLMIAGACLIYLYAVAKYEWAKLLYVALMIGVGYVAGRFHEHDLQQPRIEAARLEVHKQYKNKRDAEVARLEAVNKELTEKAATEATGHFDERQKLRAERDKAIEEAKRVKDADSIVFDVDDIDILNKLRHPRKRARVQGGR